MEIILKNCILLRHISSLNLFHQPNSKYEIKIMFVSTNLPIIEAKIQTMVNIIQIMT